MTARRGATGLSGMLVIDKPGGMTSHDVIAYLRRTTGEQRIGHAGTLDPLATGVLVVLIGPAARLSQYVSADRKSYLAQIAFGVATDTLDADGEAVSTGPVPPSVLDSGRAQEVLDTFLGPQKQTPPAFSAIKRQGVPAYRRARKGEDVAMEPRDIVVDEAELVAIDAVSATWEVRFSVSKGTYIRSLARDIGAAMGVDSHLAALRRTRAGALSLEHAIALEDVASAASDSRLSSLFIDPVPVLGFPHIEADAATVQSGRNLAAPVDLAPEPDSRISIVVDDRLGAIYRFNGAVLVPEAVFLPGVAR